jgi:hypothetical protein
MSAPVGPQKCSECGAPVRDAGTWLDGSPRVQYAPREPLTQIRKKLQATVDAGRALDALTAAEILALVESHLVGEPAPHGLTGEQYDALVRDAMRWRAAPREPGTWVTLADKVVRLQADLELYEDLARAKYGMDSRANLLREVIADARAALAALATSGEGTP